MTEMLVFLFSDVRDIRKWFHDNPKEEESRILKRR